MSATAGGRRVVSVLVADVAGSTSIAERLGPERSKFLFDDVVRLMREEVERFGGTVAQLTGDGVLALFGTPVAHEDDSERAVRAAVAIRDALEAYATDVGIDLAARVAVNTGPVVVPDSDAPAHELYNALGDTVNVAARLQTLGDLVVGPATAHQVEALFELDDLGEQALKGKSAPVAAFRVVGVGRRETSRPEPPLVGRTREVELLGAALDGLLEGRGAVVSITGEPGIGKSRLVAEAEQRFSGRVRFLAGHAVAYAESIPYWPVRELLRDWLGLGVSEPEARVRLELRTELARSLPGDAEDAYPFLAQLLGLALEPANEARIRDLAGDAVQHETFYWLERLVGALARERPLCFVLDDLHWSDEATLALLDELLPAVEETAVAFVLIHRSDPDHPAWQLVDRARRRFRRSFTELEVEPLAEAETRQLAEVDAGGDLPDELARALGERAGGNPYFVGEAVRDLRERGALVEEDGRLMFVGEIAIPAALQQALQARLDRLDAEARAVITTAAVIGRSFGLPLLERLLPKIRLPSTLSELQWLQLVVEERAGPGPEYRFRHGLVQEAAYGTLTEGGRRGLHLGVAEALVELHRDSPAEVYGLLGHHFAEADDAERAVEYLIKAGDGARAVHAQDEAIALYRRALGFMDRTGDDARARRTLLRIALTHHLAFDYAAANDAFAEAFARPAAAPMRMEPTERLTWAVEAAGAGVVVPVLAYSTPTWYLGPNLFRGLLSVARDLAIEPDLAERVSVSDDGCLYRFTLLPDARWSDGRRVTAGDFAFTYARIAEEAPAPAAKMLEGVTAQEIDAATLEIRVAEPRNHFLSVLASPALAAWPHHIYERDGRDWHRMPPLVCNGAFMLASRDDERLVLETNPTWHGARGNVRQVHVMLEESWEDVARRWHDGEFDVLHGRFAEYAIAAGETFVERAPAMYTWYLGFNATRSPVDDPRVRLAAAHAIDRGAPAAALGAAAAATGGLIPPTMPGHSQRVAPPFDPARARALLEDARGVVGEIALAYLGLWAEAAESVAAQLEGVGLSVRPLPLASDAALLDAIREGAHAFVWAWSADSPDPAGGILEPILSSLPVYSDHELQALLARAASLHDQDERLRTYREYERRWIGDSAAVVPLAYADSALVVRTGITGMWMNEVGMSTFAEVVVDRQKRTPVR